jgi:hypothetical protein
MESPTREQRDAFEQLCLLRALYAHRGPLDRATESAHGDNGIAPVAHDDRSALAGAGSIQLLQGRAAPARSHQ